MKKQSLLTIMVICLYLTHFYSTFKPKEKKIWYSFFLLIIIMAYLLFDLEYLMVMISMIKEFEEFQIILHNFIILTKPEYCIANIY